MNHTPTPWPKPVYENDTGPGDEAFWEFWRIEGVGEFRKEEDALFVHRACNSHDGLVNALTRMMGTFKTAMEIGKDGKDADGYRYESLKEAEAALKAAKE